MEITLEDLKKNNPFKSETYNLTKQGLLYKQLKDVLTAICELKAEAAIDEIYKDLMNKIQ